MIDIRNRLMQGGVWLGMLAIANAVLTLIFNALLTRLLDPADVGRYFIAASVAMMIASFMLLGTDNSVVRLISSSLAKQDYSRARTYLYSVLILCALTAALVGLGFSLYYFAASNSSIYSAPWSVQLVLLVGCWTFVLGVRSILASIFRGIHEIGLATLFSGLASTALAVILLGILFLTGREYSFFEVASGVVVCISVASTVAAVTLARRLDFPSTGSELRLKETLKVSLPLVFATAGFLIMRETHLWVVGGKASAQQVAYLGAVLYLVQVITVPLRLTNSLIQPSVAHLYAVEKRAQLNVLLRGTASIVLLCAIVGCGILLLFGETLLSIVYGEQYKQAVTALNIIIIGQLVNIGVGSPGVLLTMAGYERVVMISSISASLLGISASFVLSPSLGHVGGAIGVALTFGTHNILLWAYSWTRLKSPTHAGWREFCDLLGAIRNYTRSKAGQGGGFEVCEKILSTITRVIVKSDRKEKGGK